MAPVETVEITEDPQNHSNNPRRRCLQALQQIRRHRGRLARGYVVQFTKMMYQKIQLRKHLLRRYGSRRELKVAVSLLKKERVSQHICEQPVAEKMRAQESQKSDYWHVKMYIDP